MVKLAKYLKPFLLTLVIALVALFIQAMCNLNLPYLMSQIVNRGLIHRDPDSMAFIIRTGIFMLGITLLSGSASVAVGFLSTRIAAGVARNLRHDVFTKVESFSSKEFDAFSTASLITRCTNDITQVQILLGMGIRLICFAPIMGIGGVIMALRTSVSMSWMIALAVIVLLSLVMVIMSIATPKFKIIQALVDKLNRTVRETLNGLMVIRAFGTQKYEKARFDGVNTELARVNLFVNRVMIFMGPVMTMIMNGVTLLILWVGTHQVAAMSMEIGDMMAFMQYTTHIIMSFLMLSMMFMIIPRTAVSADRIAEVLDSELSIRDPEDPRSFPGNARGQVVFDHVSFRYPGADTDALRDISFTAESGLTTAIIGSTGSGKSTVASLILRFYDVTEGAITVGGVDIRKLAQQNLRSKIGYVPQRSVLLSGTIGFNMKYGKKEAAEAEIREAAEIAQAWEFIGEKPEQFEAALAQGGANVSGGQKQRLSIARALVKEPEILIFDDSFSALDFKTDAQLRRALREKRQGVTRIVIAQRVGTIMQAEQILVMDKGQIIGRGTHRELLKSCPAYYEIASSQLAMEELA
ncbi:ABC-type multidrug/protein/lipid transport system, ATPase component [Treponema primitia ZAS-2]|uniref:ABC-type multidrug/protein/lipid transport system, ATPase component n=1 Tax=Treponema primitia (strain ATCC BAA-887 / DSM 12427 / ZAS-2) TaxID=545694 RepID=F5YQR3_TREPZ|nr:ABC transporter ATP-binding protein [Treponema primitia]AEF84436.1 ABC-type multidrug/protein/lipid transport system, ATPase component [Treponema primitia ZAS-2]